MSWHFWFEKDDMPESEREFRDKVNKYLERDQDIDCETRFFQDGDIAKLTGKFIDNHYINDKQNIRASNRRYYMLSAIKKELKKLGVDYTKIVFTKKEKKELRE